MYQFSDTFPLKYLFSMVFKVIENWLFRESSIKFGKYVKSIISHTVVCNFLAKFIINNSVVHVYTIIYIS